MKDTIKLNDFFCVLLPKVVPRGKAVRFSMSTTMGTLDGRRALFKPGLEYNLDIISIHDFRGRTVQRTEVSDAGTMDFEFKPSLPGEHRVGVYAVGHGWQEAPLLALFFFVIPVEWIQWRPYRGDLHMHTVRSDGRESPV